MAKLGAQSGLNQDNWNEEDWEAGRFAQTSEDNGESSSARSSVFDAFKDFVGVTLAPAVTPTDGGASPFSLLSGISKPIYGTAATTSALRATICATTDPSKMVFSEVGSRPKEDTAGSVGTNTGDDEYAANVKALNVAVAAWISEKVKENLVCTLRPIFKDHENDDEKHGRGTKSIGSQTIQLRVWLDKFHARNGLHLRQRGQTHRDSKPDRMATADTSIGQILLNIMCVPTPKTKPPSVLLPPSTPESPLPKVVYKFIDDILNECVMEMPSLLSPILDDFSKSLRNIRRRLSQQAYARGQPSAVL
ncbi:nucleoporin [Culex quinquefasciatus]|uniref:Nucleoporin n=1 Tax=Culex quinquefasciatus TaxID=7176 RepID=B0WMB3_CULQU|nr:nucleoporin [Culex quinquefasciatus]|eukprot:XP_001849847.1 nucleoporin [Culex quinquefasciatus]